MREHASRTSQFLLQAALHLGPLAVEDGVVRRVARAAVRGRREGAQEAVEARAQALDGAARAGVALVGLEGDAEAAPGLERVAEQQQLRLRVGGGPLRLLRKPGVA